MAISVLYTHTNHFHDFRPVHFVPSALASVAKYLLRYGQLVLTPGVYRFTVVVSGDGVKPATIRPVVSWTGTWDRPNLALRRRIT